jgi:hypothetical protein
MANGFKAIVQRSGEVPRASALPANDARLARVGEGPFLMRMTRPNVLLVGSDELTRAVLETQLRRLRQPIATWAPGEPLVLPPNDRMGTLILSEVDALGPAEQTLLFDWLGSPSRAAQVISTASMPLFPRVIAGAFSEALYYRLNTIYVDVLGADTPF